MVTPELDLLVVGGLTVDRFADGRVEPGGSVLHIVRALAPRGTRLGVVTAAGPEPAARRGAAELQERCALTRVTSMERSMTFRHHEANGARRLWLEYGPAEPLIFVGAPPAATARTVLLAPVAGELAGALPAASTAHYARGAILQGWLRATADDGEIVPLAAARMDPTLRRELGTFDLLMASREDLDADGVDPFAQLAGLRAAFGHGPTLVLTGGIDGVWVHATQEAPTDRGWHLPVAHIIRGVPTVGAGDVFAAAMLAGGWDEHPHRAFLERRARHAMDLVAEVLEGRR